MLDQARPLKNQNKRKSAPEGADTEKGPKKAQTEQQDNKKRKSASPCRTEKPEVKKQKQVDAAKDFQKTQSQDELFAGLGQFRNGVKQTDLFMASGL